MAKSLYGFLFIVLLPMMLILWVSATEEWISLPVLDVPAVGWILSILGIMTLAAGVFGLMLYGKGLPMNPYPPGAYVAKGAYHYVAHPIYTGAVMLSFGMSILTRSTAAFWLISPVLLLGAVALVLGYERDDLKQRFPEAHPRPLIRFPENINSSPKKWDRISAWILVIVPAMFAYSIALLPGTVMTPISTITRVDLLFRFSAEGVWFILIVIPFFLAAPLIADTKAQIRGFMISALMAIGLWFLFSAMSPFVTVNSVEAAENSLLEYLIGHSVHPLLAFPAWPIVLAFVAAPVYFGRYPSMRMGIWFFLLIVTIACLITGLFSIIDLVGAFMVVSIVGFRMKIWHGIRILSEKIADSWKEWTFGPVRVINHGFYAGTGVFLGVIVIGVLLGVRALPAVFFVVMMSMIGAAVWAQVIEGSAKLLRPLGFYGGVIGTILGCILVPFLFKISTVVILTAFAVAGPWVQGWGRLRCLVQGCCHGRPTTRDIGIRFYHKRSRVTRLSDYKGVYLHPTQVYSILGNIVIGVVLLRLWFTDVPGTFIIGLYLILSGLARFVEEEYRGEPQTPVIRHLRLYQWVSIVSVIIGAVVTTIPYQPVATQLHFSWVIIAYAVGSGIVAVILTGVDFPRSNRRFSRLV
ncbi:MAG TPA: prolipoprotein diacylglyceryl transferase family protein [Balneolales bacterium]|nr:prolipoprotein diacylglyceryl transferase family protein [Balneolales bacterium]